MTSKHLSVLALMGIALAAQPALARQWDRPVQSMLEIRTRNTVRQNYDISCGAAVLATILKYQHGINVTEKEVALGLISREEYINNPDSVRQREGFSLLDMKRFAASYGLVGEGFSKMTFQDLVDSAPVITMVSTEEYRHFVIFRGVAGNRVLLIDPNFGNTTMTIDQFEELWRDFGATGRIGFVVHKPGETQSPPGKLMPRLTDYWFFG